MTPEVCAMRGPRVPLTYLRRVEAPFIIAASMSMKQVGGPYAASTFHMKGHAT